MIRFVICQAVFLEAKFRTFPHTTNDTQAREFIVVLWLILPC